MEAPGRRSHRRSLAALAGLVMLTGCASGRAVDSTVVLPSASASVQQVAAEYLAAAKAGNCGLTRALTLSHTWAWCRDPRLVDYRTVAAPVFVAAAMAGRNVDDVTFEMDTDGSSDGTIPRGWQPWGLELTQTAAGWRLWDQGTG